jgi:hypothetical protein
MPTQLEIDLAEKLKSDVAFAMKRFFELATAFDVPDKFQIEVAVSVHMVALMDFESMTHISLEKLLKRARMMKRAT